MATNFEFTLQYKSEYLELSHEISKLRNDDKEVPENLTLKAFTAECLAGIPDDELDALLSDLKKSENWYITEQEKNFIQLGRGYLSLLYLKALYESAGNKPPDDLVNGIEIMERQVRDISHEIEQVSMQDRHTFIESPLFDLCSKYVTI